MQMYFKYSKWDGSQAADFGNQQAVIDQISEFILKYGVPLDSIQEQTNLDFDSLEDEGYIKKVKGKYVLSPKGLNRMERKAMLEIFAPMRKCSGGSHESHVKGSHKMMYEESKGYEYGDPLSHIDLNSTLKLALRRSGASLPIEIEREDFMVYESEDQSRCATVMLLDMSGSMLRSGKFYNAKKVALALQGLVQTQFLNDKLYFVGFYSFSKVLKLSDLPYVMPRPVRLFDSCVYRELTREEVEKYRGRIPEHFTNIHEGLRVARRILANEKCQNKQILLITDGEPTAHYEGEKLFLIYPPNERSVKETLREAGKCRKEGIIINTFALIDDFYYFDLANFVGKLTNVSRGRAFYPTSAELGRYVLDDYVVKRRKMMW